MREQLAQIRSLLDELESQLGGEASEQTLREFGALELPTIVQDVVDYLMPILTPYQVSFYWHLFRHSIAASGSQRIRVSTRKMQSGVVLSAYTQSRGDNPGREISLDQVRKTLSELEMIGAIRKDGEPNRDGTLYFVAVPEEIVGCREAMQKHSAATRPAADESLSIDFYNVRENRLKIFERDGYKCRYCAKQLTRFTATLDHVQAVSAGGDNSYDNLVTACLGCNSKKTGKTLGDFIADAGPTAKS